MFRTVAATLTLTFATAIAPAYAADRDGAVSLNDSVTAVVAADATPVGTDASLPAIHFGQATRGGLLPTLYVSLAALNALDAYTTSKGLSQGASESNPMMRAVVGNQATLWAVKGGATAGSIFLAERLWRNNRKAQAIAVMVATNGMMAAVSARNASVIRQQR
jgi:hypothetical protein